MNRNRFANNERRLPQFRVSRKSSSGREEPVWPVLAKFHRFGNILFIFVKWLRFYSVFGKFFNLLWKIVMLRAGFQHGQILKNNIAIWSHWEELTFHFFLIPKYRQTDRQCDQVGQSLNGFWHNFLSKGGQIFNYIIGSFELRHLLSKNCCSFFLGNFLEKIGLIFIPTFGHTSDRPSPIPTRTVHTKNLNYENNVAGPIA